DYYCQVWHTSSYHWVF
nr:immunoglobulin light chain junction region [Macaca mulatta]MOW36961.1 immunoglobulin light chain junction region [Macaca mulatta]